MTSTAASRHTPAWGHAAMIGQTLVVSMGYNMARLAAQHMPPPVLLSLRMLCAATIMLPVFFLRGGFRTFRPRGDDLKAILILATIGVLGNQGLFMWGLKYTTAANSALIYALTPTFVLLMAAYWTRHEQITVRKLLAIGIALLGVVVIFLESGISWGGPRLLGNVITLGAVFCWSVYLAVNRRISAKYDSVQLTAVLLILAGICCLPIAGLSLPSFPVSGVSPRAWAAVGYLVLMNSLVAFFLIVFALKRLPASQVALYTNLQPVGATMFAILAFGEHLTWLFAAGAALTLLGVFLLQKAQR